MSSQGPEAPCHLGWHPLALQQLIWDLIYCGVHNWTQYIDVQWVPNKGRWIISSLSLLALQWFIQDRQLLAWSAARTHCSLLLSLLSAKIPGSLSVELHPSQAVPSLYHHWRFFIPSCRTWHMFFLNWIRFLSPCYTDYYMGMILRITPTWWKKDVLYLVSPEQVRHTSGVFQYKT